MKVHAIIPVILFCAGMSFAQEDYVGSWSKYREITINTTNSGGGADVAGTVNNFPVLVRLTSSQPDVFVDALPMGADIRFTDATGTTRLPHQRERFDVGGELAEFWVLVPTVTGNASTTIRMYWNKAGVADSSSGPQVFDTTTWRSVWHLGDATGNDPRANSTYFTGLTGKGRNFDPAHPPVSGVIALADSFPGGTAGQVAGNGRWLMVDSAEPGGTGIAPSAFRFPNGQFTATLWAKHTRVPVPSRYFQMLNTGNVGTSPRHAIQSMVGNAGTRSLYFRFRGDATGTTYSGNNASGDAIDNDPPVVTNALAFDLDVWVHIGLVISRGDPRDTLYKYLNGAEYSKVLASTATSGAHQQLGEAERSFVFIGRPFEGNGDSAFAGVMDELAFANATRSPDWMKLTYETQRMGATAVTVGGTNNVVGILGDKAPSLEGFAVRRAGTSMLFTVPEGAGDMRISVSDFQGRTVWSRAVTAGAREISWDGKTQGRKASAGLYLVRLTSADASRANAEIAVRKFTLNP